MDIFVSPNKVADFDLQPVFMDSAEIWRRWDYIQYNSMMMIVGVQISLVPPLLRHKALWNTVADFFVFISYFMKPDTCGRHLQEDIVILDTVYS